LKNWIKEGLLFTLCIIIVSYGRLFSQTQELRISVEKIIESFNGDVGISIIGIENQDTLSFNGSKPFPMQSVYKFPLALAVLNQIDKGKFNLTDSIIVKKEDLLPNTWSPLREKYPNGDVKITLAEIISFTVSQSDNNGCDILFRLLGGPHIVNEFLNNFELDDIEVISTEEEMHKDYYLQYKNFSTPIAMSKLFFLLFTDKILLQKSNEFLWEQLVNTSTGPRRLRGLLPKEAIVAHKTGSSGTKENGFIAALNDAGIIVLPGGRHFVVTVFISNTTENDKKCEDIIAKVTRAVWDFYLVRN
jgi:beta-lactamase class A